MWLLKKISSNRNIQKMKLFLKGLFLSLFCGLTTCQTPPLSEEKIPKIGFVDAFEDETLAQARVGFLAALAKAGYSEKDQTIEIIYRNAQGDVPTLIQAIDYCLAQKVAFLAACPTLAVVTAMQKTKQMPVCSMVSTQPSMINLVDKSGKPFPNQFGVYDGVEYIGTAVQLIKKLIPKAKKIGLLYNQTEIQSVNAYNLIQKRAQEVDLEVVALPANNSNEVQTITEALLDKNIDAFFATPDNAVFGAFEVIFKLCQAAKIPIFTSEEGLVKRGAVCAYGADMYQWGYEAGETAAKYLKTKQLELKPISGHRRVYNSQIAQQFKLQLDESFTDVASPQTKQVQKPINNQTAEYRNFYLAALVLGLGFTAMAIGIFISMRIFDIPDITTDGSYTLGGVITALLLIAKIPLFLTFLAAISAGALAGVCTGLIHTRLKINALLAGILVMTALYSINLSMMGRSNLPLIETANLLEIFNFNQQSFLSQLLVLLLLNLGLWALISYLLKTDFGLAMRATGNSETMIRANGVNTQRMKTIGLGIANALTAFSGFLIVQYQGFADINMGIGIVIIGLGSVMIGETITNWLGWQKIQYRLAGIIAGTLVFRLILAITLALGISPNLLKLVTAVLVLLVVSLPNLGKK
jgi:putative tryptophan/tyrosine transport system permease protein